LIWSKVLFFQRNEFWGVLLNLVLFATRKCHGLSDLVLEPGRGILASLLFGLAVIVSEGDALGQNGTGVEAAVWPADAAYRAATAAADLTFPALAEASSQLTTPRMALIKPAGEGPFPALVIMHQCSGPKQAVLSWAHRAVARRYAVLLVDSLGPRGATSVCYGPQAGINLFRGARDALQAAEYLRHQPFVDADRVALLGFSWGAMVGLLTDSPHYVEALRAGAGFAAVASFYPGCFRIFPTNGRPPLDTVNTDVARPLLVLMGEVDTETPASECLERLEPLKRAGAPVEWHVYPQATHCWDCEQFDGFSKIDIRGHHVEYHFRQDVTRDSEDRLFAFLDRTMGRKN
jgi:dienelactone hydrolase